MRHVEYPNVSIRPGRLIPLIGSSGRLSTRPTVHLRGDESDHDRADQTALRAAQQGSDGRRNRLPPIEADWRSVLRAARQQRSMRRRCKSRVSVRLSRTATDRTKHSRARSYSARRGPRRVHGVGDLVKLIGEQMTVQVERHRR
jgi:hypothetical protein